MYDKLKFDNEKFEQALREKNLTKVELATQIGISSDAFTKYRKGRVPKTAHLYAISQFFDKRMEWFLVEDDETAGGMLLSCEEPHDESSDDLTLEEMYEILEKLMSNDNNLRGWTVVQFRQAFGKYCQKNNGVKEEYARYTVVRPSDDKKNIQ